MFFRDFPSVSNGTRRLVMSFRDPIPSSVSVADFPVRVFYTGQPVICSICHEPGHQPRACPFLGLCLRCKQPDHVARNCRQAWGPSVSNVPVPVSSSSAPVSMSVDPPVSSTASTSSTVSSPVSTISAPVSSVPPATVPAPVSPVTAVSTPVPSVLPVSTSVTSAPVPVSSHSVHASSSRPSTSARVVKSSITTSSAVSADMKRLSRLLMNKARQHSVFHTADKGDYYTLDLDALSVFKTCQVIVKTHKLNVSEDEAHGLAAPVAEK